MGTKFKFNKILERKNFQIYDIVLLISHKNPTAHWPLGKVIEMYPGKDGYVRILLNYELTINRRKI